MPIPDSVLETVRTNPVQAAYNACDYVLEIVEQTDRWSLEEHELLLECYALISAMADANLIKARATELYENDTDLHSGCYKLHEYLGKVREGLEKELAKHRFAGIKSKFDDLVAHGFSYEFTEGDINRIQVLVNELRTLISENSELEDQHKRRLLKRLEKLQSEMHKKMSDLDHFYGLTVEGSVMLKKVGGNLKPIVDRITEITKITWATQSRAEDLPSGSEPPLLGHDDDSQSLE